MSNICIAGRIHVDASQQSRVPYSGEVSFGLYGKFVFAAKHGLKGSVSLLQAWQNRNQKFYLPFYFPSMLSRFNKVEEATVCKRLQKLGPLSAVYGVQSPVNKQCTLINQKSL